MKKALAAGMMVGVALMVVAVSTSQADPKTVNVPPHRHFVKTPDGSLAEVGPRICGNPQLQKAFNQFHANVHAVTGSSIGPAAPGLHNFVGADLSVSGC